MQADMAEHQRRFQGETTAISNQALAADAFQRLENELAEAKPIATTKPESIQVPPEEYRREINGQQYKLTTSRCDDVLSRKASPAEAWFIEHAMPRVEMLLTKLETGPLGQPSWNQRVMGAFAFKAKANDLKATKRPELAAEAELLERQFVFQLMEVLEASNATFGDWKKDAPKKLIISGR
jgi:hypothetical protein